MADDGKRKLKRLHDHSGTAGLSLGTELVKTLGWKPGDEVEFFVQPTLRGRALIVEKVETEDICLKCDGSGCRYCKQVCDCSCGCREAWHPVSFGSACGCPGTGDWRST